MNVKQTPPPAAAFRLQGASNFRDFGGWPTADGARVRRARLYRSNKLSLLTTPGSTPPESAPYSTCGWTTSASAIQLRGGILHW
jgi:hypothetical protein